MRALEDDYSKLNFAEFCYKHNIHAELFWWEHFTHIAEIIGSESDSELKKKAVSQFLTFKINAHGVNIPTIKGYEKPLKGLASIKMLKFAWPYVNSSGGNSVRRGSVAKYLRSHEKRALRCGYSAGD